MDWNNIVIALIGALGTFCGALYGIRKSNSITDYKIEELTREVRKHNRFAERVPLLEQAVEFIHQDIEDLKSKVE